MILPLPINGQPNHEGDKTNSLYLWDPDKTKTNKVYSYGAHWLKYNQKLNIMAIKAGECLT